MENNLTSLRYPVPFCRYEREDWQSNSKASKKYTLKRTVDHESSNNQYKKYAFPYLSKCGNALIICQSREIQIIKRPSFPGKGELAPVKHIQISGAEHLELGLTTPNGRYYIVIVDQGKLNDANLERSYALILYYMSLGPESIIFDEMNRVPLPFAFMNKQFDVYLVNDEYAVIFQRVQMFVYKIEKNFPLLYSVDLAELANKYADFGGLVCAACWYNEDILLFVTMSFKLYSVNLDSKEVCLLTSRQPGSRQRKGMDLFYISSQNKEYFCVIDKPIHGICKSLGEVNIWLVEKSREQFSTIFNRKSLTTYISHLPHLKKFCCNFHVNSQTGKCFLLIGTFSQDYFGLFYINLIHPETDPTKILFEYNFAEKLPIIRCQEQLMVVKEQADASEILTIMRNSDPEQTDALDVHGTYALEPNYSLRHLVKMYIKRHYTTDEISIMELPRTLKQYLLG